MIETVRLEDWKSHKETQLAFTTGINALVGEMGSGKSAVLEAITFALFGTLPSLQDRTISLDDLIRRSPTKADQARVEVGFSFDDSEYTVARVIKRDGGTKEAKLYEDGDLIAGPQATEVTTAVEDVLTVGGDGDDVTAIAGVSSAESAEVGKPVSVEVRDETGTRLDGAVVEYDGGRATTDDQGRCELTFDTAGSYELTIRKEGAFGTDSLTVSVTDPDTADEGSTTGEAGVGEDDESAASPEAATDQTTGIVVIPESETVTIGAPLDLTVRDDTGGRMSGVRVTAGETSATTDDRGRCQLVFDGVGE